MALMKIEGWGKQNNAIYLLEEVMISVKYLIRIFSPNFTTRHHHIAIWEIQRTYSAYDKAGYARRFGRARRYAVTFDFQYEKRALASGGAFQQKLAATSGKYGRPARKTSLATYTWANVEEAQSANNTKMKMFLLNSRSRVTIREQPGVRWCRRPYWSRSSMMRDEIKGMSPAWYGWRKRWPLRRKVECDRKAYYYGWRIDEIPWPAKNAAWVKAWN